MSNPLVTLAGVSKHYGGHRAISVLDLDLREGECVALAGHNGAGKSTLIKLILGLIRPTHEERQAIGHPRVRVALHCLALLGRHGRHRHQARI